MFVTNKSPLILFIKLHANNGLAVVFVDGSFHSISFHSAWNNATISDIFVHNAKQHFTTDQLKKAVLDAVEIVLVIKDSSKVNQEEVTVVDF